MTDLSLSAPGAPLAPHAYTLSDFDFALPASGVLAVVAVPAASSRGVRWLNRPGIPT